MRKDLADLHRREMRRMCINFLDGSRKKWEALSAVIQHGRYFAAEVHVERGGDREMEFCVGR